MSDDLAERIDQIGPTLRSTEAEAEAQRHLPAAAVDALSQAGLFRISAATEVGGDESHPTAEMEAIEAVTRYSSSAGWNLFVGCLHTAIPSGYVSDLAAEAIWGGPDWGVVAGQMAPIGVAVPETGGVRVNGRYSWGSGINHSSWVLGGARVKAGDAPAAGFVVFVVPKQDVIVHDNWHVLGVSGSGSFDYEVSDVFVPDGFWFDFLDVEPRRGGSKFHPPIGPQLSPAHIGFATGVGRRALDEITQLAASRQRALASVTLAQRETFHHDLGVAHARLSAARDHGARVLDRLAATKNEGRPVDLRLQNEIRSATTLATEAALAAAQTALRYGGGAAVRLDNPLQRLVRELLVAQSHVHVVETNYDKLGVNLLEEAGAATTGQAAVNYRG